MVKTDIRNAATVIVHRSDRGCQEILMGQRGAAAAFMPNKVVFPGGAVDRDDHMVPLAARAAPLCMNRLADECAENVADALIAAAIRELWEEAGLILGVPGEWHSPPPDWIDFAATGHVPSGQGMRFVFRAITPPGRPRRFDARFFTVSAQQLCGDIDDFSRASDELSNLQWIRLEKVREFDLPFITQVVLSEVTEILSSGFAPEHVPFFRNDDEASLFMRLGLSDPQD